VLYEKGNPSNARLASSISNKMLALILIGIAVIVAIIVYINFYFTMKNKNIAAIEGGLTLGSQVMNAIKH